MAQIVSARDPNSIRPEGGRIQLESGNALPKEDLIADLATAPSLKASPYAVDEYGAKAVLLGDNIFQGSLVTIPVEHHEIHCGDSYETSYTATLGNGATQNILIIVPNETGTGQSQKLYHLRGGVDVQAEATITFFEGTTVSANGTTLDIFNRNRNSALVDFLGIYHTPTVTNAGTQLEVRKVGSGRTIGGTSTRADEWVLKNNETYLLRIKNDTNNNMWFSLQLDYYVHPGV